MKHYGFWLILVLYVGLRVASLNHGFWEDEAFSALTSTQEPVEINKLCRQDVHPPLYYQVLRGWNRIGLVLFASADPLKTITVESFDYETKVWSAGNKSGEIFGGTCGIFDVDWANYNLAPLWFLRSLSIFTSVVALLLFYGAAVRLFPKHPSIILSSLFFMSVSGYSIYWSTVIRNYSFYSIFIGMAFFCIVLLAKSEKQLKQDIGLWSVLLASLFLGLITNYMTLFFMPALFISAFALKRKVNFLALLATINIIALLLFWIFWGQKLAEHLAYKQSVIEVLNWSEMPERFAHYIGLYFHFFWRILFSFNPTEVLTLNSEFSLAPLIYFCAFLSFNALVVISILRCRSLQMPAEVVAIISGFLVPQAFLIIGNLVRYESLIFYDRYFFPVHFFFCIFLGFGFNWIWEKYFRRHLNFE